MKSSTPASLAMVAAVRGLSPVIITVLMPMRRNSAKRSTSPSLTVSLSSMTPRIRPSLSRTSGVPPRSAIRSLSCTISVGSPPTLASMASVAPFRIVAPDAVRTPLVRVSARNGISSAIVAPSVAKPASSPAPPARPSSARRLRARSTTERPSGVSSRIDATRAASTASASGTPGAAVIDAARRLPYVIVPVLSSRMTSTSPDASTARPLIARTLNRATRSMPAMPIAESRPPMVVGMRQTSRAMRATVSTVVPA